MKSINLYILLASILSFFSLSIAQSPSDLTEARQTYCSKPPFLQDETYANLLLVIDSSGSMQADAYDNNVSYDQTKIYKGFFDEDAYYACWDTYHQTYISTSSCRTVYIRERVNGRRRWVLHERYWKKIKDNQSPPYTVSTYDSSLGVDLYSGNYLNYDYMKRVDVIRWVLTGGYTTTISSDGAQVVTLYYGQNIYYKDSTSYNPDTDAVEGILQKTQRLAKKPRIGAYFFQSSSITLRVSPSYNYSSLISAINTKSMSGYTPTKYAMEDARRYFSLQDGNHGGFDTGDSDYVNPYEFTINNKVETVPCAKNFVLLLTDGEWNTGGDPIYDTYNMWRGGTADLVNTLSGNQNAKVYSIALFLTDGSGKNAVKHMAIFGGFHDNDNNKWPCGYNGYPSPNSFATPVDITNSSYSSCRAEWDADFDGLPDTFASGEDPEKVKEAIEKVFKSILTNVVSGTSVSVLSEKDSKGALVVQAVFYPQRDFGGYKVDWMGQLFSYWFLNTRNAQNIREDTDSNYVLNIEDDKILEFSLDTNGKLYINVYNSDSSGNKGSLYTTYNSLDEINYLWEAGKELKNTSASSRTIYTVDETGDLVEFNTSNLSSFQSFLGTNTSQFPACLKNIDGTVNYEKLVRYIRGEDISGCRKRQVDSSGNVWKLGDIIYSSPKIVYYRDYGVVYVGSNDGMLHAFKVGKINKLNTGNDVAELTNRTNLGKEVWAFIPKHVLPYLRYLADPEYCHIYMHDLSPYILNADYDNDGVEEIVLIGGLRLGGACAYTCTGDSNNCSNPINPPADTCSDTSSSSCIGLSEYYALDISDPETPKLLWEFTHKDLGFSYSGPGIVKTIDNKYHIVFGSGPVNYTAQFASNENNTLKLFVLALENGNLERIIDTEIKKAFAGRIFSKGLDFNDDTYTDYLAIGYTRQDGSPTNYKGGIIILGGEKTGTKLGPFVENVNYWNFKNVATLGTDIGPVTAKVEFMRCFNRWYMYLGTGRWFAKDDDWEVGSNKLFGIPLEITKDNNGDYYIDIYTGTQDVTDENLVDNVCREAKQGVIRGWYIRLDNGEKMITDPSTTTNNLIIFATVKPNQNVCSFGGDTRLWTLNCATGGKPDSCQGIYEISNIGGSVLLQLSGGDIQQIKLTENMGRTTNWFRGIAPENAPPTISFNNSTFTGEILLWLEK